jgi:Sulfotransferase domain
MTRGDLQPVFIVGQYKCGTSWLVRIFSAHPDVIGVAEIDIVGASCNIKRGAVTPASAPQRLERFFTKSTWCNCYTAAGWEYTDVVARFEQGEDIPTRPWNRSQPNKFMHLSTGTARALYHQIKSATSPEEAMDAFLAAVCADARQESHVVLKAADQISKLEILQAWQPTAKKIVITRDGRDAAISAQHFEELMSEIKPWHGSPYGANYWDFLRVWADRADKTLAAASRGQVYVLRYEDLTNDFVRTVSQLFNWLGIAHAESLISSIQEQTSFQRITGRPRGTETKSVMRKGVVGEWRHVLNADDQARSWRVAAEQLSAFGYSREGALLPLPDLNGANELSYRLQRTLQLEEELSSLQAQVREFKAQARKRKIAQRRRWAESFHLILRVTRNWTKHLVRLFVSVMTVAIPRCNDALDIAGWIDA